MRQDLLAAAYAVDGRRIPFTGTPGSAVEAIKATLSALPRVAIGKEKDKYLHAVARSEIFRFPDDLEFFVEGIARAMAGGRAVATFVHRALTESLLVVGPAWSNEYRRTLGRRMRVCRAMSFLLRQPTLVRLAVHALQLRPQLASPIERSLSAPFALVD